MSVLRFLHLAAFVVPLAIFTWLLLVPHPPKPELPTYWLTTLMDKTAHASGYAFLTAVGFLYPQRINARWRVVGLMMLHGIGTEIGQTYTGRHGCVQDVLIDWTGIALGVLAVRLLGLYRPAEKQPTPEVADSQSAARPPE